MRFFGLSEEEADVPYIIKPVQGSHGRGKLGSFSYVCFGLMLVKTQKNKGIEVFKSRSDLERQTKWNKTCVTIPNEAIEQAR